ncbi:hypothetical protein ACGC1H_006186 [Rhizoctonia solani]
MAEINFGCLGAFMSGCPSSYPREIDGDLSERVSTPKMPGAARRIFVPRNPGWFGARNGTWVALCIRRKTVILGPEARTPDDISIVSQSSLPPHFRRLTINVSLLQYEYSCEYGWMATRDFDLAGG